MAPDSPVSEVAMNEGFSADISEDDNILRFLRIFWASGQNLLGKQ